MHVYVVLVVITNHSMYRVRASANKFVWCGLLIYHNHTIVMEVGNIRCFSRYTLAMEGTSKLHCTRLSCSQDRPEVFPCRTGMRYFWVYGHCWLAWSVHAILNVPLKCRHIVNGDCHFSPSITSMPVAVPATHLVPILSMNDFRMILEWKAVVQVCTIYISFL